MKMEDIEKLEEAMLEFSLRVLRGEGNMQETATLPKVLELLLDRKPSEKATTINGPFA